MERQRLLSLLDKLVILLILVIAAALRSNLSYRTAFVDEAMNAYYGWQMLQGIPTYIQDFHMGYAPLTQIPIAYMSRLGGVEHARALSAVLGVLSILFVMLTARKVYGKVASYIAGGMLAVFAPHIFISTFAHYDVWSVFFASVALYLWVLAILNKVDVLLFFGSLMMTLGVLAKYAGVTIAALMVVYALGYAVLLWFGHARRGHSVRESLCFSGDIMKKCLLFGAPFLILVAYVLVFRESLQLALAQTVLTRRLASAEARVEILTGFGRYIWLPLLVGLTSLFWRRRRAFSVAFLPIGLSMLVYHLANNDTMQLHKHVNFMYVGLAPLASGGIVLTVAALLRGQAGETSRAGVSLLAGSLIIAYLAFFSYNELPELRSYWSDTTQLIAYLRENVRDGDLILMEGGDVGRYYLIVKGEAGYIPEAVVDTWWYQDEEGEGKQAYERGIRQKRFDFIVFDDKETPAFNAQLRELMEGRYRLEVSFPAFRYGSVGEITVYRPVP